MNRIRKNISIFTAAAFFLLFSISPAFAEDINEPMDTGPSIVKDTAETKAEPGKADDAAPGTSAEKPVPADDTAAPAGEISEPESGTGETTETVETADDSTGTTGETTGTIEDNTEPAGQTTPVEESPEPAGETIPVEESPGTEPVQLPNSKVEYLENPVLNVVVPIAVSITIDPLELAGKGQIYSDTYKIRNNGDTDVLLTFSDIQVTFADDINFEALSQPFDERTSSDLKSIFMMLDFGRSDMPPAVITDFSRSGPICIPLSPPMEDTEEDSLLQFNFCGSVNYAPAVSWKDSDVKISMNYTLQTVPPPMEENDLPEQQNPLMPEEKNALLPEQSDTVPSSEENAQELPGSEETAPGDETAADAENTDAVTETTTDGGSSADPEAGTSDGTITGNPGTETSDNGTKKAQPNTESKDAETKSPDGSASGNEQDGGLT